LVRPEYELNIGFVARLMKNFGVKDLALVKPKHLPENIARMYSKHAQDILEDAKIYKTLEKAVEGFDLVVGTSGRINKDPLRGYITPKELTKFDCSNIAVVFGPEGSGLNAEEIKLCDLIVYIPTSKDYPIMNLSHAVCVILYELFQTRKRKKIKIAKEKEKNILLEKFSKIVNRFPLKNGEKVKLAFKRIVNRGKINDLEVKSLLSIMTFIDRKLSSKKHKIGKNKNQN